MSDKEPNVTAIVESLKSTVEAMTLDELAELTGLIDDRLLAEPDDAFIEELERRRMAFENGSSPSRPAEDVIRDMRARFA
jgi:phage tail sheath protein FI